MTSPINGNKAGTSNNTLALPPDAIDHFITSIKGREAFLSANCKTDYNSAYAYLNFLINIQRFDEAYKAAVEISEFLPDFKNLLSIYAFYLNDSDLVKKHIVNFDPDPEQSTQIWLSIIFYHFLIGTLDELIVKPHPKCRDSRLVLLFLACDNFTLYKELIHSEKLSPVEQWFLWSACFQLEFRDEQENILDRIITNSIPLPPLITYKRIILDQLVSFTNEENRAKIATYLTGQHLANPECVKTMTALAAISEPVLAERVIMKLKAVTSAFPNLNNKFYSILHGPSDWPIKIKCLFKLYESNPRNKSLHHYLVYSANVDADTKIEVIKRGLQVPFLDFHMASIEWSITKLEEKFAPDIANDLLDRINGDLKLCPHNRFLLIKKAYLLCLLNNHSEAIETFRRYVELFGPTLDLVVILNGLLSVLIDPFIVKVLREAYDNFQTVRTREALKRAYVHQNNVKGIEFILETLPVDQDAQERDFESIELILLACDTTEGELLLEAVPRTREKYAIILKIAYYYADLGHKKALDDIEFLKRYNLQEPKIVNVIYLANSGNIVDAANELIASKINISDEQVELLLIKLNTANEHKLAIELFKKVRPKLSYEAKKHLALSYYSLNLFQDALSIYKTLILEDPKDIYVHILRANCYERLNMVATALDVLKDAKVSNPTSSLIESAIKGLEEKQNQSKSEPVKPVTAAPSRASRKHVDPSRIPHLVADKTAKEERKEAPKSLKGEKVVKNLQKSSAKAVDPLADPLAKIKEIARIGETQTGPKVATIPAPAPVAAIPKAEAPKPIVKLHLTPRAKVFIKKGADALNEVFNMKEALLEPDDIFYNRIYAILRAFIPLRLNSTHSSLINDLKRIRDNARHDSDQISHERLTALFTYLKSISLIQQMNDWIREKSIITRLMLNNHIITVRKPKKTPLEKAIAALEYIIKKRGDKASWNDRLYHRNGIKACVSIIGEASNFMPQDQRALLAHYRENGTVIAHDFFEDGDTVAFLEKYKEEDIAPDELWDLTDNAETLLKTLRETCNP